MHAPAALQHTCNNYKSGGRYFHPMAVPDKNTNFVVRSFGQYYKEAVVPPPPDLPRREFGMIRATRGMWRHLAYRDEDAMRQALARYSPLHVYHSSAYYENPSAPTMEKKVWQGADLVFDLDADHIPGTEEMSYSQMLDAVKGEFKKLIYDFLLGDFGFDEKDIKIIFSGGRGYHAHVTSEGVKGLNSHERREIVDYITLPHKDLSQFVEKKIFDVKEFRGHVTEKHTYSIPGENSKGWNAKFRKATLDYLDQAEKLPEKDAKKQLEAQHGIGKKMAGQIWNDLFRGEEGKRGADIIRRTSSLEAFTSDAARNRFVDFILERVRGMAGETDEPVTSDIKRLIRLPGSLHGKSSLVVKPFTIAELDDFEPLTDCVWDGWPDDIVKVVGLRDEEFKLLGTSCRVEEGEVLEIPYNLALFSVCRKICGIV